MRIVAIKEDNQRLAQRLYNDSTQQPQKRGQRSAILTIIELEAAELIITVLATGPIEALTIIVPAVLELVWRAILVLPTVVLSGN